MDRIVNDPTGLRISPLVTLAQIAADTTLQRSHTALVDAASHVATPQIRNAATIGGNLLQRPKCWYFRHEAFQCLKKGGDRCFALEGDNEFLAIFDNQTCPIVHASTMATVIEVRGSTYRRPGARMLVIQGGRTVGSISGGCLEADVFERAQQVMRSGEPTVVTYDTTITSRLAHSRSRALSHEKKLVLTLSNKALNFWQEDTAAY